MVWLVRIGVGLLSDAIQLVLLLLRSSLAVRAGNLVLRKQLAQYIERGVKPRRVDSVARISLALLSRLFDWRNAIVIVRPKTIIRWHRAGWRLFWRFKCKMGRPPIPAELRALIRKIASENPVWGEERIANELLIKLGIRVSPRTVAKYMPKRLPGQPSGDQRWATFLMAAAYVRLDEKTLKAIA
jgi:putative transposase